MFINGEANPAFYTTHLSDIYTSTFSNLNVPEEFIGKTETFYFAKPNTYHARILGTDVQDFIPTKDSGSYKDVVLGTITLPEFVCNNGLDLPFKYQYSITPCMNYGKLNHLTNHGGFTNEGLCTRENSDHCKIFTAKNGC